jgi:hypothetical protein
VTNEERRAALNEARTLAQKHARIAEAAPRYGLDPDHHVRRSRMWAAVAEAMKDGDPMHDAPDGRPTYDDVPLHHLITEETR